VITVMYAGQSRLERRFSRGHRRASPAATGSAG
jgi:hypothetical protein